MPEEPEQTQTTAPVSTAQGSEQKDDSTQSESPSIQTQPATETQRVVSNTVYSRSEGMTDGLLDVPEEAFTAFLEALEERNEAAIRMEKAEKVALDHRQKEARLRQQKQECRELIAEKKSLGNQLREVSTEIDAEKEKTEESIAQLKEELKNIHPGYGWISIVLFLLAGVVFIAADVSITHDIVATGLRMSGSEAWLFAVGLAFVAFLLKPAYDRIFEKAYPGQFRKRNHWFLASAAILSIAMLVFLGIFRHEAGKLVAEFEKTSTAIASLQSQATLDINTDLTRNQAQIDALTARQTTINQQLTSHWSRVVGLVMAGVMMAIGGAVCLGIALPAVDKRWKMKYDLGNKMKLAAARVDELTGQKSQVAKEQSQAAAEAEKASIRLEELQDATEEAALALAAEAEWSNYLAAYHSAEKKAQTALYSDMYARGQALSDRYQIVLTWKEDGTFSLEKQPRRNHTSSNGSGVIRTPERNPTLKGKHLHERIRNYLSDQLND